MGGYQALQWALTYPDFVRSAIPIACGSRLSTMALASSRIALEAIFSDPDWCGGDYYGGPVPSKGLSLARMIGHLTYTAPGILEERFGNDEGRHTGNHAVHHYLREKGARLVQRFDAGSYVALSRAIEGFDLTAGGASLADVFRRAKAAWLLVSFSSDCLFPVQQVAELAAGIRRSGADVDHVTIETEHGHDAFFIDWPKIVDPIREFLKRL
jgi:homoserine O-acetyltransferase